MAFRRCLELFWARSHSPADEDFPDPLGLGDPIDRRCRAERGGAGVSRSGRRVQISRDKLVGVLLALACLAFSAIGLEVNDPADFTYVDGVRGQTVDIEQAELVVGDVRSAPGWSIAAGSQAETQGMFVLVRARLEVPGPQQGLV